LLGEKNWIKRSAALSLNRSFFQWYTKGLQHYLRHVRHCRRISNLSKTLPLLCGLSNGIHLVFVISKIPVFVIFSCVCLIPCLFSSFLSLTYNRRRLGFVGYIINTFSVTIIIMRWRYNMSINLSPSTQGSHINKRSASISAFGASFFILSLVISDFVLL
jgi:hypothetical protein